MNKFTVYQGLSTITKALFTILYLSYAVNNFSSEEDRAISLVLLSLTGVSIIFDLGLSQIFIGWSKINNSNKNKVRKVIATWYLIVSLLTSITCFLIGVAVFLKYNGQNWIYPLFFTSASLGLNIYLSSALLIDEALGKVDQSYYLKMLSSVGLIFGGAAAYILDFGQYFLALAYLISSLTLLHKRNKIQIAVNELRDFFKCNADFIKKTSMVWISGFLFWHSPVLISAKYLDYGTASEFSITFNLLNSINFFALSILMPYRSIVTKEFMCQRHESAEKIFMSIVKKVISLWLLSQLMLVLFYSMPYELALNYKKTTLSGLEYIITMGVVLLNFLLQIGAIYMRCAGFELFHKPLVALNFITPFIFFVLAANFKLATILIMWLISMLFILVWCANIYREYAAKT